MNPSPKDVERFWKFIRKDADGCWAWTGGKIKGYGNFWLNGRTVLAHRVSLFIAGRDIPPGMEPDHLCKNAACVNPEHLEIVTPAVNKLRSGAVAARVRSSKQRTHCKRGHEFTPSNTYLHPRGWRFCRACKRLKTAESLARSKQ